VRSKQIDLGFSVAEHMNIGWPVFIDVNDNTQGISTQHGDRAMEETVWSSNSYVMQP
jgi:hypothetical protein